MRSLILYLIFCCVTASAGEFRIVRLSTDNGLSNNMIHAVSQDKNGFLWVATSDGLCRYDGYRFLVFKSAPGEQFHIGESVVNTILTDEQGNIWAAAENLHLYQPHKEVFIEFTKPFDGKITGLSKINDQLILIHCSEPSTLWIFNVKEKKYIEIKTFLPSEMKPFQFIASYTNGNGDIWLSRIGDNRLFQFTITKDAEWKLSADIKTPETIISFSQFQDQTLILGTNNNDVYCYKNTSIEKICNVAPANGGRRTIIKSIAQESNEVIWLGTDAGLFRYDIKKGSFERMNFYSDANNFTSTNINDLCIDCFNQLWVATSNGLSKINLWRHPIEHYKAGNNGLPDNQINSIYKDQSGTLWIATSKGLASVQEQTKRTTYYSSSFYSTPLLLNDVIFTITGGPAKSVFLGSVGINKIDFSSKSFGYVFPNPYDSSGLHSFVVWKIHQGRKSGKYWIATIDGLEEMIFLNDDKRTGVYKLPVVFKHHLRSEKTIMPCSNVWDVYEDTKGLLWIATNCGLCIYNPSDYSITNYNYDPKNQKSIGSKAVKCIYEDSKSRIWLGTEGGGLNLFVKEEGSFKIYRQKDGMPSDVVWGIMEDSLGFLWITTPLGLSKFDTEKKKFKNYGYAEGFQSDIFNRGAYFKDDEGRMYVGGNNGLNVFRPTEIKDHQVEPRILFNALYLFNQKVSIGEVINNDTVLTQSLSETKEVRLNYKNSILGIEFVALHFLSPQKNQYAYMLEGYDKNWTNVTAGNRIANYMNLPAGTYTFKVKASNADDVWTQACASINIVVLPAFWNTWWFRVILIVFFIIIVLGFVRYKINEIERQNSSLEAMVKERTNEIEQQKEELAAQADNLQEINYLLKENQEKVMAQSEELQTANKALVQANATKDTLFSIIAHDLKNPFQVILSTSQKLATKFEQINEIKKREFAEAINKSSNDIFILLQNLLEWSRSQMNKIRYQPEAIEIYGFCEEIIEIIQIQAKSKKVSIQNNLSRGIQVYADRNMISTVFRNLLSNAIKFNKIGGTVTLNAYPVDSNYEIIISDTGIGMDPETLKKLFNLEEHFTTSGTLGEQGTGLGLIICLEFVTRNQGTIRVESTPGLGTNFIIKLPASFNNVEPSKNIETANTFQESHANETTSEITPEVVNTGKLVLLVEDNPVIRQNIKDYLKDYFNIIEAENGKEGWVMALEFVPDLIVSDLMMPEMNGIELCRKIKNDEKTNHIPFILLTASDSEINKIEGLERGADDYILKPFNSEVLRIRMMNLIRIREELKRKYNTKDIVTVKVNQQPSADEVFLQKIIGIIEKNISDQDFSVEDLSKEVAMSYIQFYRKIENLTGQAPGEIMRVVRLNKAAEILTKNQGNISQTAYEVGFKDPSYFAKSFKKHFGMSPTDYLKSQKVL